MIVDEEQQTLQKAMRHQLAQTCPPSLVRRVRVDDGGDEFASFWKSLGDAGFLGLSLPHDVGGGGGTFFDVGLLMQEAGRVVAPQAMKQTLLFGLAVQRLGDQALRSRWLPRVSDQALRGAVVASQPSSPRHFGLSLVPSTSGGWRVNGEVDLAVVPEVCQAFVVWALADNGRSMVTLVVDLTSPGLTRQAHQLMGSRDVCRLRFDDVEIGADDSSVRPADQDALDDVEWVQNAVAALESIEAVGGAEAVLDRTVEYIKQRVQFGRPIGSFQAAQHHVANVSIAVEAARLAALQAVWLVGSDLPVGKLVAIARAVAADTFKKTTLRAHQLHGGLGMTLESDLHLFSERAKLLELNGESYERLLERLGDALADE